MYIKMTVSNAHQNNIKHKGENKMELRKQLELVEVAYNEGNTQATLTYLDEENGEVLEVKFNKQSYDQQAGKFVKDNEKAKQVEEWCKEYFDCSFDQLTTKVGEKRDIYKYEKFNSLWEANYAQKFSKEHEGIIFQTKIESVVDNGNAIVIEYKYDDVLYSSKMNYSKFLEHNKTWFVDPIKRTNVYEKFQKKFGVPVEQADSIVGKEIMVEVKVAFGTHFYGDIKKPNWK